MVDFVNIASFSPEVGAAIRRVFGDGSSALPPAVGEDDVAAIEEHGIAPLLFSVTRHDSLRPAAVRAAAIEPLRLRDLREVLAALGAQGVAPLILKGTALAHSLYAAPDLRPRTDTDLLIARDAFPAARDVLTRLGFEEQPTSGDELGVRQHAFSRFDSYGVSHTYDVHLDISNSAVFASVLGYEELMAASVPIPSLAPTALGLGPIDALLLACLHRVAHHYDSDRLIWLYDIHLLRERMTPVAYARFWRIAQERGVVAVCDHSFARAEEWFGERWPGRAAEHLGSVDTAHEVGRAFLDRDRRRLALLAGDLAALPGWRARVRRLRQLLFPPAEFMRRQFGIRSAVLLPWAYAYRGLRGVGRLFRRVA